MRIFYHETAAPLGQAFTLDEAMPEGWHDSPAAWGVITCPSKGQIEKAPEAPVDAELKAEVPAELTKDDLLAVAEQRGITVDKRWGIERLKAALHGDGT
jgi:hypothetical protein